MPAGVRLWRWMRQLDERAGLRPRLGQFDCAWCRDERRHERCTGTAVRPPLPMGILARHRLAAEVEPCGCMLRGHVAKRPSA
jgi:hypothetical protein